MAKTPTFADIEASKSRSTWDTIVVTTPVILTVVATILAGLSSSEMSSAQYYRALAAQMQSKVSDQWGYFQAKKLRAEQCANTVAILGGINSAIPASAREWQDTAHELVADMQQDVSIRTASAAGASQRTFTAAASLDTLNNLLRDAQSTENSVQSTSQPAADALTAFLLGNVPTTSDMPIGDQSMTDAVKAVGSNAAETDLARTAAKIPQEKLEEATAVATQNLSAFDDAVQNAGRANDQTEKTCKAIVTDSRAFGQAAAREGQGGPSIDPIRDLASQLSAALSIAQLNFNANRYQREAQYNQTLAQIYELQVRRQAFISDRHRQRSKEFFYGMLGAQAGVTIATFSLAVKRKSILWGIAAASGLLAVSFAAYVYLFV